MDRDIKKTLTHALKTLLDTPSAEENRPFFRELARRNRGRLILILPLLVVFFGANLIIDVLVFNREGQTYFIYLDAAIVGVSLLYLLYVLLVDAGKFSRKPVFAFEVFILLWAAVLSAFQGSLVTLFIIAFMAAVVLYVRTLGALVMYTLCFFAFYTAGRLTGSWYIFTRVDKIELVGIFFWAAAASRMMLLSKLREFRYSTRLEDLTRRQEGIIAERTADLEDRIHEREVLIQEIHHRVKNNLQILVSLSNLSVDFMDRQPPEQLLLENRDRILSMALAHECMYNSGSLTAVSMKTYLTDLLYRLLESAEGAGQITPHLEVEDLPVDLDTAIQIGLVVTEVINVYIRPRPKASEGRTIKLHVEKAECDMILSISFQDAEDCPEGVLKPGPLTSLLVVAITDQLAGTCEFSKEGADRFVLRLPHRRIKNS